MHTRLHPLSAACLLGLALASPARAANDEAKYTGDKLSFPVRVHGNLDSDKGREVCIPAATSLRGLSDLDKDKGLKVRVANLVGKAMTCDNSEPLPSDQVIVLSADTVTNDAPTRYGLTYGGLVVPFKYHLSGAKEFAAGGTVAPYLGYRFDQNYLGLGVKVVGFLGGAGVPVEQTVDGQKQTQTLAGLSYGLGVIGTVKGQFQLGLILGADRVSKSANYAQNGKWWAAMGVGFAFSE